MSSPRGPGVVISAPFRNMPTHAGAVLPVAPGHAAAVGAEPPDVRQARALRLLAEQERRAAEHRVLAAQPISRRVNSSSSLAALGVSSQSNQEISLSWHQALLLPCWVRPDLVAAEQHRRALRQQQRGEEVALLARAQLDDRRVVGRALDAEVPGAVVVGAVAVVLQVRLVVLLVVGDEVAQREAVVRGDEVDRGERVAAVVLVQVAGAGQARGEVARSRPAPRQKSRIVSR